MKIRRNILQIIALLGLTSLFTTALIGCSKTESYKIPVIPENDSFIESVENDTRLASSVTPTMNSTLSAAQKVDDKGNPYDWGEYQYTDRHYQINSTGAYTLSGINLSTEENGGAFGTILPTKTKRWTARTAPDGNRNGYKTRSSGGDSIYASYFYTNLKLGDNLVSLAKAGKLEMKIYSKFVMWGGNSGDTLVIAAGYINTDKVYNGAKHVEIPTSASNQDYGFNDGGRDGGALGSSIINRFFKPYFAPSNNGDHRYFQTTRQSGTYDRVFDTSVNSANVVNGTSGYMYVSPNNIDNGGMRLGFMYGLNSGSLDGILYDISVEFREISTPAGSGTISDPFRLSNESDFDKFKYLVDIGRVNAHAKLTNNITLSGNHTPIAPNSYTSPNFIGLAYTGTFDGGGYAIYNLIINNANHAQGLFGRVGQGGEIKNLSLQSGSLTTTGSSNFNGAFAGVLDSGAKLYNCQNYSMTVRTQGIGGGLVGYGKPNSIIERCTNYAAVSSQSTKNTVETLPNGSARDGIQIGGIVGITEGSIIASANTASVTADTNLHVGGIAGGVTSTALIEDCYNSGAISSTSDRAGGIICRIVTPGFTLTRVFNYGNIRSSADTINDGLVNFSSGGTNYTKNNCYTIRQNAASDAIWTNGTIARLYNGAAGNSNSYIWKQGTNHPQIAKIDNSDAFIRFTYNSQQTNGTFNGITASSGGSIYTLDGAQYVNGDTVLNISSTPSTGYKLGGAGGNIKDFNLSARTFSFTPGAPATVTLNFIPISYTVIFHSNYGSDSTVSISAQYASYASAPTSFARTGCSFSSWNLQANGGGQDISLNNGQFLNLTATDGGVVHCYARWTMNGSIAMSLADSVGGTYNSNGFTVSFSSAPQYAIAAGDSVNFSYAWYKEGASEVILGNSSTYNVVNVADSGKYYCRVTATMSNTTNTISAVTSAPCTVTINPKLISVADSGSVITGFPDSASVGSSAAFNAAIINKTGYGVDRIYYTMHADENSPATESSVTVYQRESAKVRISNYNGTVYPIPVANVVKLNLALGVNIYDVTYSVNYTDAMRVLGGVNLTATLEYSGTDATLPLPSVCSRNYYQLEGWYANSSFSAKIAESGYLLQESDFADDTVLTIYAKWTPVSYDINYYLSYNDTVLNDFAGTGAVLSAMTVENFSAAFIDSLAEAVGNNGRLVLTAAEKEKIFLGDDLKTPYHTLDVSQFVSKAFNNSNFDFYIYIENGYLIDVETSVNYAQNSVAESKIRALNNNYELSVNKGEYNEIATRLAQGGQDAQSAVEWYFNNALISDLYGAGKNVYSTAAISVQSLYNAKSAVTLNGVYNKYNLAYKNTYYAYDNNLYNIMYFTESAYVFNIESYFNLPIPRDITGFTFDGYYIDPETTSEYSHKNNDAYTAPIGRNQDLVLYAKFKLNAPMVNADAYDYAITFGEQARLNVRPSISATDGFVSYEYKWLSSDDGNIFSYIDNENSSALTVLGVAAKVYRYKAEVVATFTPSANTSKTYTSLANLSAVITVTVGQKTIARNFISNINESYTYTGAVISPEPTVQNGITVLIKGVDYELTYGNNKNVADYSFVTITGKGNYGGEVVVSFDITRRVLGVQFSGYTDLVYDKTVKIVTATATNAVASEEVPLLSVRYSASPLNADRYTAYAVLDETAYVNYTLSSDNYVEFYIAPKTVNLVYSNYNGLQYNGEKQTISCEFASADEIIDTDSVAITVAYGALDAVIDAGIYIATATLNNDNYVISESTRSVTFEVSKKQLSIEPQTYTKKFGEQDPIFTIAVDTGILSERFVYVTLARPRSGEVLSYEDVGVYNFNTIISGQLKNFIIDINGDCSLIIDKNDIFKVSPQTFSKVYGDSDPVLKQIIDTGIFGISVEVTYSRDVGENAGSYNLSTTISHTESNRFTITAQSESAFLSKFVISRRQIDVSIPAHYKTYGDAEPTYNYTINTQNIADIDKDIDITELFPLIITRIAGENYRTAGYNMAVNLNNNNYTARVTGEARFYINKKALTIEGTDVTTTKVYDGTNAAEVVLGTLSGGDASFLTKIGLSVSAQYQNINVGKNIDILVTYSVYSSERENLILPEQYYLTGSITPASLRAVIADGEMIYGDEVPVLTVSYSGFASGDSVYSITEQPTVNYGGLTPYSGVNVYTITMSGGKAENYIIDTSDTAKITVNAAILTVEPGATYTRPINGTNSADIDKTHYVVNGIKNNDSVEILYRAITESAEAGPTYVIMTIFGTSNPNYITETTVIQISAQIMPLPVISLADSTFIFDGSPKYVFPSAFVLGETYTNISVTYKGDNYEESNIAPTDTGLYYVRVVPLDEEYVSVVVEATLTILKATPIVTIEGVTEQVYGDFKKFTAFTEIGGTRIPLDVKYSFNNDNLPKAGVHSVSATYEGSKNYNEQYANVQLIVLQREISLLFTDYTGLIYSGYPQYPKIEIINALENDIPSLNLFVAGGVEPKNAGTYTVNATVNSPDYVLKGQTGIKYTIAKRKLSVAVDPGGQATDKSLDVSISYNGFAEGDDINSLYEQPAAYLTGLTAAEKAVLLKGGSDPNYEFVFDTSNAVTVEFHYERKSNINNVLYIILGAVGVAVALIVVIAAINKKRTEASFIRESLTRSK